jgi:hypothetical protein
VGRGLVPAAPAAGCCVCRWLLGAAAGNEQTPTVAAHLSAVAQRVQPALWRGSVVGGATSLVGGGKGWEPGSAQVTSCCPALSPLLGNDDIAAACLPQLLLPSSASPLLRRRRARPADACARCRPTTRPPARLARMPLRPRPRTVDVVGVGAAVVVGALHLPGARLAEVWEIVKDPRVAAPGLAGSNGAVGSRGEGGATRQRGRRWLGVPPGGRVKYGRGRGGGCAAGRSPGALSCV